jgi:hypothetical protein
MQEEKAIQRIIQMAEFYKKPDEFINLLQETFKNVPYNKKGGYFFQTGLKTHHTVKKVIASSTLEKL